MSDESTYIEIDHIDDEGLEGSFGIKIGAQVKQDLSALDIVKKLFSGTSNITGARFISEAEYDAEYGGED